MSDEEDVCCGKENNLQFIKKNTQPGSLSAEQY